MTSTARTARENSPRAKSAGHNAITLLRNDHREVEGWFSDFQRARSADRRAELATAICTALTVHALIEEEMFYPAFLAATGETAMHHEAEIEHEAAKRLIEQVEESGPDDEYFTAKVKVLESVIRHHVKEEEKRDGIFAKARASSMDLAALGEEIAARKTELTQQFPALAPQVPQSSAA